jgi:hypothetical protein
LQVIGWRPLRPPDGQFFYVLRANRGYAKRGGEQNNEYKKDARSLKH